MDAKMPTGWNELDAGGAMQFVSFQFRERVLCLAQYSFAA